MRPKSLILLSLALGCGLVAALGINQMMANQKPGSSEAETAEIFVLVKDVNINDPLKKEAFKLEKWPKDKLPMGAITKLEDVENRRARTKLFSGEPILEAKLLAKGEDGASGSDFIPEGYRVVHVRVDAVSSAGNMIKPGDRVDMLVHLSQTGAHGITEPITKTFLQDVKVFAVNDLYDRDPANGNAKITAQTIGLLVKPEDVELVAFATEMGKIRLSMRSPADEKKSTTGGGVVVADIMRGGGQRPRPEEVVPQVESPQPNVTNALTAMLDRLKSAAPDAAPDQATRPSEPFKMTVIAGIEREEYEMDGSTGTARLLSKESSEPAAVREDAQPSLDESNKDAVKTDGDDA